MKRWTLVRACLPVLVLSIASSCAKPAPVLPLIEPLAPVTPEPVDLWVGCGGEPMELPTPLMVDSHIEAWQVFATEYTDSTGGAIVPITDPVEVAEQLCGSDPCEGRAHATWFMGSEEMAQAGIMAPVGDEWLVIPGILTDSREYQCYPDRMSTIIERQGQTVMQLTLLVPMIEGMSEDGEECPDPDEPDCYPGCFHDPRIDVDVHVDDQGRVQAWTWTTPTGGETPGVDPHTLCTQD